MSFYVGSTVGTYQNIKIGDSWNQTNCASCWQDYKANDRVIKLACRHIFHESCYNTATGYRKLQGIKASCLTCVRESDFDPNNLLEGQRNYERYRSLIQTTDEELLGRQRPKRGKSSASYQISNMSEEEKTQVFEFARIDDPISMQEDDVISEAIDEGQKEMVRICKFVFVATMIGFIGCLTLTLYSTGS